MDIQDRGAILEIIHFGQQFLNSEELEDILRKQVDDFSSFQRKHFIPWAKEYDMDVDDLEKALQEGMENIFGNS